MSTTTGWPPGLLQDDCKKLSQWFASRIDARHVVRQVCREIRQKRMEKEMTDKQPDDLPMAIFWAEALERDAKFHESCPAYSSAWLQANNAKGAAALLRTQHAEIERKDALLRQALAALDAAGKYVQDTAIAAAITRELQ